MARSIWSTPEQSPNSCEGASQTSAFEKLSLYPTYRSVQRLAVETGNRMRRERSVARDSAPLGCGADGARGRNRQPDFGRRAAGVQPSAQRFAGAREGGALYWVALGRTTPDIAKILDSGSRTINKHLELI
ncbi:MAG: hypothetical protein ACT4QA_23460 [Panacagrimonas sp.]